MKPKPDYFRYLPFAWLLLIILLSGCTPSPKSCPQQPLVDLADITSYAGDDQLTFRYPLDQPGEEISPLPATFCASSRSEKGVKYHAAEDYFLPPGTPVYAFADGEISFSGPMGGYGWLVIIDHPQFNLYSLYGHLSPSRWRVESGSVEKDDRIAYLGDPDENGGSAENPLRPHLHFGIRAGQRMDYPGMGEWRWMAGWIKPCPADLGWQRPSEVITSQAPPPGGFIHPSSGLVEKWGSELLFISIYFICGASILFVSLRKKKPLYLAIYGVFMIVAGWIVSGKATRIGFALYAFAVLALLAAGFLALRRARGKLQSA